MVTELLATQLWVRMQQVWTKMKHVWSQTSCISINSRWRWSSFYNVEPKWINVTQNWNKLEQTWFNVGPKWSNVKQSWPNVGIKWINVEPNLGKVEKKWFNFQSQIGSALTQVGQPKPSGFDVEAIVLNKVESSRKANIFKNSNDFKQSEMIMVIEFVFNNIETCWTNLMQCCAKLVQVQAHIGST